MNKKGFTLLELLAAIVVLAVLLILAVPQVYRYISGGKKNYYKNLEKSVSVAAADYMQDYRALLPRQVGHVSEVNVSDLVDLKYIDDVKDEDGNSCGGRVVIVKDKKDDYKYYSCLECNSNGNMVYKSDNTNCSKSVNDNVYADSDLYYLTADQLEYEVPQMTTFSSLDAHVKVYKKINDNESVPVLEDGTYLEGTPKTLKITDLNTKQIVYYYHGAILTIKVKGTDTTKPGTVVVNLLKSDNNKKYSGTWYNNDIIAKFKSTDYSSKGIEGSGIDYYEVSSDGVSNWQKVVGDSETLTLEGEYTRYVRSVDKNGNISDPVSYTVKIDKTKPTCTWSGESTDWQPNLNLAIEERVNERTVVATCHDERNDSIKPSGCMQLFKSRTKVYDSSIKTDSLSYLMADNAGNYITCEKVVDVYIDKTDPTITGNNMTLGNGNYNFINNVTVSDAHSGVLTASCDPISSRKTGNYNVTCTVKDNVGRSKSLTFNVKHNYAATCEDTTEDYWKESCSGPYQDSNGNDYYSCYCPYDGSWDNYGDDEGTCKSVPIRDCRCPQGGNLSGEMCYY